MAWRDRILERETNPCTHPQAGRFCPDCGRAMEAPARYSFSEMLGPPTELWLKKGFRRTLFGLTLHPGRSIRSFLFEDRDHLVKPAAYLVLSLAFNLWVDHLLGDDTVCAPKDGICQIWQQDAFTLEMIQIGIFALAFRLLFRRSGLNLWEYGIGFAYIIAQSFVISAVLSLSLFFLDDDWRILSVFLIATGYIIWGAIQLLQIRGVWRTSVAVLTGFTCTILFMLVFAGLGALVGMEPETAPDGAGAEPATAPAAAIAAERE